MPREGDSGPTQGQLQFSLADRASTLLSEENLNLVLTFELLDRWRNRISELNSDQASLIVVFDSEKVNLFLIRHRARKPKCGCVPGVQRESLDSSIHIIK